MIKSSSPCNSLCKTTQVSYMAWPSLNLCNFYKSSKNLSGGYLQNDHTLIVKDPNAKLHLTMMISGSEHPKNIYNMSLFEIGIEKEFNFEFKFKFELK